MIKETAAKLFILARAKGKNADSTLHVLEILALVEKHDLGKIIDEYKNIVQGELKVIQIFSASEISKKAKTPIESALKEIHENLVFLYFEDKSLLGGLMVKIGDDVVDETVLSKIRKFKV